MKLGRQAQFPGPFHLSFPLPPPPLLLLFWKWTARPAAILHEILDRFEGSLIISPPQGGGLPAAPCSLEPMGQAILSQAILLSSRPRNGHVRRRNHLGYSIFFLNFFFLPLPSSSSSSSSRSSRPA